MAKRPTKGVKTAPGPAEGKTVGVIHLKGSTAYAAWLASAHKTTHLPRATIIRLAVAEWARVNGMPEPPEF